MLVNPKCDENKPESRTNKHRSNAESVAHATRRRREGGPSSANVPVIATNNLFNLCAARGVRRCSRHASAVLQQRPAAWPRCRAVRIARELRVRSGGSFSDAGSPSQCTCCCPSVDSPLTHT
jgi:hypothetical protein